MVKIFVFDTETTGIVSMNHLSYDAKRQVEKNLLNTDIHISFPEWQQWIKSWPFITQLSYIVYDTERPKDAKIFNKYIDLDVSVEIEEGASKITHMYKSREDAIRKGVDPDSTPGLFILNKIKKDTPELFVHIRDAMYELMSDLLQCQYIVSHNVDFDKKMILAELYRVGHLSAFATILANNRFVCTMQKTINMCKITAISKKGNPYYKFPKLSEAYETLFGYKPTGKALHNALIDVVICLRIFCKLGEPLDIDIQGMNKQITELINSISPPEYRYKYITPKEPNFITLRSGNIVYKL
uniref:Exonuclease domain-containing protein n=1 Tax=viral metagenome TaxID=1070528 RepID=A0A6C0E3Q1_9ZZZZ